MSSILDTIYLRRSIRVFDSKCVVRNILTDLLKAAMAAPTAGNNRPWEFIIITDREKLAEIQTRIKYGKYNAPAAIVVCANLALCQNEYASQFWIQDCSAATENLLIASAGMGLGTLWTGVYPKEDIMDILRKALEIPDIILPFNLVYIGYPAEEKEARTQYEESRVHWEKY